MKLLSERDFYFREQVIERNVQNNITTKHFSSAEKCLQTQIFANQFSLAKNEKNCLAKLPSLRLGG